MMPLALEMTTTAHIFERNQSMLAKAIAGFTAEQWIRRPQEGANSALWILGHIVWSRSRALHMIGYTWTKPWLSLFERGSKPLAASEYPSPEEVLDAWEDLCISFPAALEAAPETALAQPAQQPSPSFDGTIGGMIGFLAMHESYHVGQVVYVRGLMKASS